MTRAKTLGTTWLHMAFFMMGRGFEQRAEERTFKKIVYHMPLILTHPPPPIVMVIFKEIFLKIESTDPTLKYILKESENNKFRLLCVNISQFRTLILAAAYTYEQHFYTNMVGSFYV